MLRTPMALLGAVLLSTAVSAQSMEEKYQQKLKKDFVSHVDWVQSLEDAQKAAKESKKLIFGYFTRSYAP